MKKITFCVLTMLGFCLATAAQTVLSHSADQTNFGGSVACASNGTATENGYWRSYIPDEFGETGDLGVTGIQFAVGSADGAPDGYMVTVNLYTTDDVFPAGNFTLVTSQMVPVTLADVGTILEVDLDAPFNMDDDDELLIEIFDNNDTVNFRIGQNTAGETKPSYLTSEACGITVPTETENVGGGFPDDFIINLVIDEPLGLEDNLLGNLSIYPNPAQNEITLDANGSVQIATAVVYDVLGKKTGATLVGNTIDLSRLNSGIYIVEVTADNGEVGTYKIVKQ